MVVKNKKNYYKILGVTPDSDILEVKTSYRTLARKFHPDVNKDPESATIFRDILEAYETLSDESRRKQYDMINGFYKTPKKDFSKKQSDNNNVHSNFRNTKKEQTYKNSNKTTTASENNEHKTKNIQEEYKQRFFREKISSILDDISRSHYQKKESKRLPKNGEDVYTEISITLTEAINGCERILNIMHKELCPHCSGRKFINGAKCPQCSGSGVYEQKRKITVKVPAGVKNGIKLRLTGEGNPGFFGGKNGNLYITIKIEKDENIQIDDNNILCKVPITPFEAVLGAEIEIPIYDDKIKMTIPPMTNSGQKFRISNKGLKTNGKFGDMIITVEIQLSKNMSEDEINMYGKLKKMSNTNIREQ